MDQTTTKRPTDQITDQLTDFDFQITVHVIQNFNGLNYCLLLGVASTHVAP